MGDKAGVWQGTLRFMVLKTLDMLGPLHGYGIARRIEHTSGDNNCKAKFNKADGAGVEHLKREGPEWGGGAL